MKKTPCLICIIFLLFACKQNKHIEMEQELLYLINMPSLSYKIELEYNELHDMVEGIYLCDIIVDENDAGRILDNIKKIDKKDSLIPNSDYFFYSWKKTPALNDYDLSFLNYSPISVKVQKELNKLKESLTSKDAYYAHYQNANNPFIGMLYLFEPVQHRIFIYYTFF